MRYVKVAGLIVFTFFLFSSTGFAIRKPSEKVKEIKPFVPITFNIGLNVNAGIITGHYGTRLKYPDGNINDQMFGGYGACFEYHFKNYYFVSFDFERGIKSYNDYTFTGNMFGVAGAIKLKSQKSSYPYLGFGTGLVNGGVDGYSGETGTSKYLLFKFGLATQTGSKMNTKFELYYRTVSLSDEIKHFSGSSYSLNAIGARFILGLGF